MITIISSTNRKNSLSKKIAVYYANMLFEKRLKSEIIDLSNLPLDSLESILYHNNGKNESFNFLKEKLVVSEKICFIVPEYNSSFPGVLKIFLEALSHPSELKNKKCALIGISSGSQGCALGLSHLTDILHYLGAIILPLKLKLSDIKNADLQNLLKNDMYLKMIEKQLKLFLEF